MIVSTELQYLERYIIHYTKYAIFLKENLSVNDAKELNGVM